MLRFALLSAALFIFCACNSSTGPGGGNQGGQVTPSQWSPPDPDIVELGTIGGVRGAARDVNASGRVVGEVWTPGGNAEHAFVWENGTFNDLGTFQGGDVTKGVAVNDAGDVVVLFHKANGDPGAATWNGGGLVDLHDLGGGTAQPRAINELGDVVGLSRNGAVPGETHATVWSSTNVIDVGSFANHSTGFDINDAGHVAGESFVPGGGSHAFFWDGSTLEDLQTFGGAESRAVAINEVDGVAGYAFDGSGTRKGFYWTPGGTLTPVGDLGGGETFVSDLNDAGQVVGHSRTGSGGFHAYIWENGATTDLGTLRSNGSGASLAADISESGAVVGWASAPGGTHAFAWACGMMLDLGVLGGNESAAWALNEVGNIVGESSTGNGDVRPVMWTVTADDVIAALGMRVVELSEDGVLNQGQATSLLVHLNTLLGGGGQGGPDLTPFINEVQGLESGAILSPAEAAFLLEPAICLNDAAANLP